MKCIAYISGYKDQLKESYTLATEIKPINTIDTDVFEGQVFTFDILLKPC